VAKGPEAIDAYLKKAGYVNKREVADIAGKVASRIVNIERGKLSADAKIVQDFPDLQNNNSELFKATSIELRTLVAIDPSARNRPATLYAAAAAAKAKLEAKKAKEVPPKKDDEDDDLYDRFGAEDEADRQRRAASQDGSRTGRADNSDTTDYMGPEAREMCRQMGLDEKDFASAAKELGVQPRARRK
jgi:hypothetical protein